MKMKINHIYHGDCLEVMKKLPDSSFDLIITSPPYNIRNSTGGGLKSNYRTGKWVKTKLTKGYDGYLDNIPYDEYVKWQRDCLEQMMRLISETGAIFYNHKWRVQNGLIQNRKEITDGFPVRQVIIWQRAGGLNFNDNYFLPTYEVIYLICKSKFKLKPKMCKYGDIWKFPQDLNNDHPAPFPVGLPNRIITCTKSKIVLDPFMGSGTTAIAALMNNINYVGIERSENYIKYAKERINNYINLYGKRSLLGS